MYILADHAEIASNDGPPLPPDVAIALETRRRHTLDSGLGDVTCIIVVKADDTADDLAAEIGGYIEEAWIDGAKALSDGWAELVVCVGNTGFAYVLLVEPRCDDLGRLCRDLIRTA